MHPAKAFLNIILVCFIVTIYSCKKDNQEADIPCRVILKHDNGGIDYLYNYDSEGRISQIIFAQSIDSTFINYQYSGSMVTETTTHNSSIEVNKYALNNMGYPTYKIYMNSNPDYYDSTYYSYNSLGYILKEKQFLYDHGSLTGVYETNHTIENGNRVYSETTSIDSLGISDTNTVSYDYYTALPLTFDLRFGLKGKSDKNLIKKSVHKLKDTLSYSINYSYELDSSNFIKKETYIQTTTLNEDFTFVVDYFYNCK